MPFENIKSLLLFWQVCKLSAKAPPIINAMKIQYPEGFS